MASMRKSVMDDDFINQILMTIETSGKEGILKLMQENPSLVKEILIYLCDNDHLLHRICILGDEELIVFLTAFMSDINASSPMGTPLSVACEHGYESVVDILLCNQAIVPVPVPLQVLPSAPVSREDMDAIHRSCPFYQAVTNGWMNILKILMDAEPETFEDVVNCKTLLKIACYGGHVEILQFCIDSLAKVTSSKAALADFIRQDLLNFCLELGLINVLPCLLNTKSGASITEDLAENYSSVIGQYLKQFVVDAETDNNSLSQDDGQTSTGQHATLVSIDWSGRSLCTFMSSWISPYITCLHDLDLRDNHLPVLPDVIPWQLVNLRSFIVSNCYLEVLLSSSAGIQCLRLQLIDLSCNLLSVLPVELFDLPSLEKLNLSHNQLKCLYLKNSEQDQPVRWECSNLKELNMSENHLDSLPFQIHSCISLTNLQAAKNCLSSFVHPWSCPLKVLDLSDNELYDLPLALDDFWSKSLQCLDLSRNSLTDLPQTICRLAALKDLNLSHNNISSLPNPDWWECMSLESLDLSHNKLGSLPSCPSPIANVQRSFVGRLNPNWFPKIRASISTSPKNELTISSSSSPPLPSLVSFPIMFSESLTELNLSHNRLKEVSLSITELRELTKLDLSHNPGVTSLPVELSRLSHLHTLLLEGLNISDNNLNLRIQSAESARVIIAYLKQIHLQCVPYHRIKLMLVGSQEKGKTSLACALRDLPRPSVNIATDGVEISEFKLPPYSRGLVLKKCASPELTVQLWDFAGQQDYYVTHKVFLSSSALYLVIFDLRLGKQGVDGLHTWLSDIQANAPDSYVIVVGTFLDCLAEGRNSLPDLRNYIQNKYYRRQGYPKIEGIVEVSNIGRKEGLDTLRKFIYDVALKIRVRIDNYGKTNLVGRMVPKDYLELIKVLQKEVERYRKEERWPVLSTDEFWNLFSSLQNNSIRSKEEMELAAQFLNESGYLLHFVSSSFNGLEPLYFIDPQWLAQILAKFITVDSVQRFARGGLINLKDAESALMFSGNKTNISFDHYVDLLESFDIALRLDNDKLLLPSKLPSLKPGLQKSAKSRSLRVEAGRLHRIYRMNHIPSGFWSRLLVQVLAAVYGHQGPTELSRRSSDGNGTDTKRRSLRVGSRRGTVKEDHDYSHLGSLDEFTDPKITFWQEGIYIDCSDYHLLIEPVNEDLQSNDSQPEDGSELLKQGVVITVTKSSGEEDSSNLAFVLATFAIDYIDSLIYQWYPGLLDEGCLEQLIPCPYCLEAKQDKRRHTFRDVHMFSLIECAKTILASQSTSALTIRCSKCNSPQIHLKFLVPDLLLLDLPRYLHINASDLAYNPTADILGQGGEGTVFRGRFCGNPVAIKQNAIIQSCQTLEESMRTKSDSNDSFQIEPSGETDLLISDFFWRSKTLSAFNGFRQETCVLARLRHPCIISMLGISAWSLSYIMELAPHGSLRHVLLKNQELQMSSDRDRKLLLNKLLVYKIIFQIICGLQYLHSEGIVYKDLKPENILIWSLDVEDVVNIKLSDYGLARRLTKQGLMGIDGTTGYQAPEIRQQKPYNEKVDIFAYAMVVHELVTGEPCFHDISSVLINKFILQGKRPINSGSRAVAPQMMSLIERCWAQNPNDRPSASEICGILRNLSFVCREMVISLEANRIAGGLSVTYWDKTLGVHHPYLRFWTGNESGRCYHIFNTAVFQFKILNQCYPGPKVSSMIVLGKLMVIGTEYPSSLQAMGFKRATNCLDKWPDPMPTDDVPLLLLQNQKMSSELYVGFANSEFHLYSLEVSASETVSFNLKQSLNLSGNSNHAIICGLSFREGNELWVSCGPDVVVLNSSSEDIRLETTIKIFPLVSSRHIINRMCCHADQVWCMSRKDSVVVELDFESRNILCILDCSQSKPLNSIVSNFDWVDTLTAATPAAEEQEVPPSPVLETKAVLRTQFGRRDRQRHSTSYRRKLMTRAKSRSTEKYKQPKTVSERVRSMCFVRGALWVGRENGDILVINVTHSNPYDFEHGQVLAVLNLEDQEKSFSTENLVNMSDERVISTRTSREAKAVRQSTQLVCWTALGLDRIHHYRQIWKVLATEAAYKKAKSFKAPSFFTPR